MGCPRKEPAVAKCSEGNVVDVLILARMAFAEELAKKHKIKPPRLTTLRTVLASLPPVVSRAGVSTLLGVPLSGKTLANHDAAGTGPRLRLVCGGVVFYPVAFLLEWLESRGVEVVLVRDL